MHQGHRHRLGTNPGEASPDAALFTKLGGDQMRCRFPHSRMLDETRRLVIPHRGGPPWLGRWLRSKEESAIRPSCPAPRRAAPRRVTLPKAAAHPRPGATPTAVKLPRFVVQNEGTMVAIVPSPPANWCGYLSEPPLSRSLQPLPNVWQLRQQRERNAAGTSWQMKHVRVLRT